MGQMQRRKGQVGEREAAALIREHTGWEVTRRVRNAAGDSDLLGVPGWSVEITSAMPMRAPLRSPPGGINAWAKRTRKFRFSFTGSIGGGGGMG